MSIGVALFIVGALLLLEVFRSHIRLRRSIDGTALSPRLTRYPPVSVIRPIKGIDAGAELNIAAALNNGYPGEVETIFVLDSEDEPAMPLVREAVRRHRLNEQFGAASIVLCGEPPAGQTGKLNAMIEGMRRARYEVLVFADSDIRPDRLALRTLVETLMSSRLSGSAFAPVYAALRPRTAGDAGYALLLNGLYGSAAAAAARRRGGEMPFIMGQFMALRREAIRAIGGLEAAGGQLVDDMYIGARVKAAGFRNLVSPRAVPIIQEGLSVGGFAALYRRWIAFSRSGLPDWSFKITAALHGIVYWSGLLTAAAAAHLGAWPAALLAMASPLAVAASINRLHTALGGAPLPARHWWVAAGLLLTAPFIFMSIYFHHQVSWRGRSYSLDINSRLAQGDAHEADELLGSAGPGATRAADEAA